MQLNYFRLEGNKKPTGYLNKNKYPVGSFLHSFL